jgi:4'-phosphopantetheinyl transferase
MPLIKIETNTQGGWAVWHITESEIELRAMSSPAREHLESRYPIKRIESLASRMLTEKLAKELNLPFSGIEKDAHGKPFLPNSEANVSLTHSYPYVAVQISTLSSVGIDVEKPSSKVVKVASRVFNKQERYDAGDELIKNCIYWCAKEALYKIYGKRGLSYADNLLVEPFTLASDGKLDAVIKTGNEKQLVKLGYLVLKDAVIVYTKN